MKIKEDCNTGLEDTVCEISKPDLGERVKSLTQVESGQLSRTWSLKLQQNKQWRLFSRKCWNTLSAFQSVLQSQVVSTYLMERLFATGNFCKSILGGIPQPIYSCIERYPARILKHGQRVVSHPRREGDERTCCPTRCASRLMFMTDANPSVPLPRYWQR